MGARRGTATRRGAKSVACLSLLPRGRSSLIGKALDRRDRRGCCSTPPGPRGPGGHALLPDRPGGARALRPPPVRADEGAPRRAAWSSARWLAGPTGARRVPPHRRWARALQARAQRVARTGRGTGSTSPADEAAPSRRFAPPPRLARVAASETPPEHGRRTPVADQPMTRRRDVKAFVDERRIRLHPLLVHGHPRTAEVPSPSTPPRLDRRPSRGGMGFDGSSITGF